MARIGCLFLGLVLAAALLPRLVNAEVGTVWMQQYAQPGYCDDEATAMFVDRAGYVYVTGRGDFGANAWDFVTIKYDPKAGIEETPNAEVRATKGGPTIVRGVLFMAEDPSPSWLLDISGRKVLDLKPGANDVRRLAPGVYLVHSANDKRQSQMARVIVAR